MIKRYGLGQICLSDSSEDGAIYAPGIVEHKDGDYVRYEDHSALLESIGAGGVSGRITSKTLEQHRKEFELFCSNQGLNLNESSETGSGLFQSHVVGWMWKAWKAARDIAD